MVSYTNINTEGQKNESYKVFPNKGIYKSPETYPSEIELYALSEREFRITIIKMLTEVKRTKKIFTRDRIYKKYPTEIMELKSTIIEPKISQRDLTSD